MSWFENNKAPSWIQRLCTSIVKSGPVPRHVAFIMDGNRRFAKKNSMDRAEGHLKGFNTLADTLQWCRDLGIAEVTVYAFSIENFKRTKEEVECLMDIARQKFTRLLEEREMLVKHGIRVCILGSKELLPLDIQQLMQRITDLTRHHTQATLNVCFAYTSRHEICDAMKLCARGVEQGILRDTDIDEELLERCLYTHSSHPDLLVRTSGEVRLSDFLLIQSSDSVLSFVRVLWPEFTIWHLYAAVLQYQANYEAIQKYKHSVAQERLAKLLESSTQLTRSESSSTTSVSSYREQRLDRITRFLDFIKREETPCVENIGGVQTVGVAS